MNAAMKLLADSAIIFFGTLLAAGLVALGEPARTSHIGHPAPEHSTTVQAVNSILDAARPLVELAPAAEQER